MNIKPSDPATEDSELSHLCAPDKGQSGPDVSDRLIQEWQIDGVTATDLQVCGPAAGALAYQTRRAELAKWLPPT